MTSKKRKGLHVILQTLGAISFKSNSCCAPFLPRFSGFHRFAKFVTDFAHSYTDFAEILPDFHQIKTFGGALAPPAPPLPTPLHRTL